MARVYQAPVITAQSDVYNHILGEYNYYPATELYRRKDYFASYDTDVYMAVWYHNKLGIVAASERPFTVVYSSIYGEYNFINDYSSQYNATDFPNRYSFGGVGGSAGSSPNLVTPYEYYSTFEAAVIALQQAVPGITFPITYQLINCTAPNAPVEAVSGANVIVNITPSPGYILRPSSVSVTDSNGVIVQHVLNGNQITFTMPSPP